MFPPRLPVLACALALGAASLMTARAATPPVMPLPMSLEATGARLPITSSLTIALDGHDDPRLRSGLARALRRVEERSGLTFPRTPQAAYALSGDATTAALVIVCAGPAPDVPTLGEDESYSLRIDAHQAVLRAPTVHGVLHGLETILQLLQADERGWFLPGVRIEDRPRFAWRGLMIDVCRHWQPMAVIKRNLDAMALVKLNVLHLHLSEDQGFRIESRKFPRLHEQGSDGLYFTQAEMREIIAYAAERCIRVVPEFDIPGHATSWLVAYPEIGSAPGPYVIERRWGIFDPVLDPTRSRTYRLLGGFLGEMAGLFPDDYIHIGGDENNGVHWNANGRIQGFIREQGLRDNAGLHAYFNNRVHAILARRGKRLVGWDEILHPDLAPGSVVHSWRGPDGIAAATARGFATILSNGYYIDLMHSAADHYLNDPIPPGSDLTLAQERLVLGGEATMWSEWVTPETIDSRIWPRTAAIAERLWSPQTVRDVDDMYRRLAVVGRRLEEAGLSHESYIDPALRRWVGQPVDAAAMEALRALADLVEPVKGYERGQQQPAASQHTALTGFVDCARADSAPSREFAAAVRDRLFRDSSVDWAAIAQRAIRWRSAATEVVAEFSPLSPRARAMEPLFLRIADVSSVCSEACGYLGRAELPPPEWVHEALRQLQAASAPVDACEIPIIPAARLLVAAAGSQNERMSMTPAAWRAHVEALAAAKPDAR